MRNKLLKKKTKKTIVTASNARRLIKQNKLIVYLNEKHTDKYQLQCSIIDRLDLIA